MHLLLLLLCVFLYLVGVTQASNTTIATSYIFEAPSFTTRTLFSIISSSVLTLFACVYTAIHPNIPSPKSSPRYLVVFYLGVTLAALVFPEMIVTWAMRQKISARRVTRQFQELEYFKVSQTQEQSESESFFQKICARAQVLYEWFAAEKSEDYTWTETHSFFLLMGGFMLYVDGKPYQTLRPDELIELIRAKCIEAPTLTADQIHDRSKGNAISKGLVILQVAWFIIQFIARVIYHLEITQLEVGTLAFAVLNFLTYAAWWHKPLNVQCPHPVYWKSTDSRPEDHIGLNESVESEAVLGILGPVMRQLRRVWFAMGRADGLDRHRIPTERTLQVPPFDGSLKLEHGEMVVLTLSGLFMTTIFGAIHYLAWFSTFPTNTDLVHWRMSTVGITFIPWLFVLVAFTDKLGVNFQFLLPWIIFLFYLLYGLAREVLFALMFSTLHNLPLGAYKAVLWTSLMPHL